MSIAEDILNRGFPVFPNPANKILQIDKMDDSIKIKSTTIFDLIGKKNYHKKGALSIDVGNFVKGVRLLKIETNEGDTFNKKTIAN